MYTPQLNYICIITQLSVFKRTTLSTKYQGLEVSKESKRCIGMVTDFEVSVHVAQ